MSVNKEDIEIKISSGGLPSSRLTDSVFAMGYGTITQGSETVYVGDQPKNELQVNEEVPIIGEELPEFEVVIYDHHLIKANEMV